MKKQKSESVIEILSNKSLKEKKNCGSKELNFSGSHKLQEF